MNLSQDFINSLPQAKRAEIEAISHEVMYRWDVIGRQSQQIPPGDWDVWAIIAGRGFGKTRTGSETVRIWSDQVPSILLVGATATDMRDIMIDGPSGILATSPDNNLPNYEPSKLRLTWPNGCIGHLRSAEDPDRIRGVETYRGWLDEFASWKYPKDAWDMISMAVRRGDTKKLITTTPKNIGVLKKLLAYSSTITTRGSTYDNIENLSESFRRLILERYEGTRVGKQEIYAEILEDVEGALWTTSMIETARVRKPIDFKRIGIGIDPAVTAKDTSDETGIIVGGLGVDNHGYVLDDLSGIYTPLAWAKKVIEAYYKYQADFVVAEVNNGGDLVEQNIKTIDPTIKIIQVRATRGKMTRAEPIANLYEQSKVHHVGNHPALETQMTTWAAMSGDKSPDRVDGLVWLFSKLMLNPEPPIFYG